MIPSGRTKCHGILPEGWPHFRISGRIFSMWRLAGANAGADLAAAIGVTLRCGRNR
jgi:hypothetical protein